MSSQWEADRMERIGRQEKRVKGMRKVKRRMVGLASHSYYSSFFKKLLFLLVI
jgi:hypothetical protein